MISLSTLMSGISSNAAYDYLKSLFSETEETTVEVDLGHQMESAIENLPDSVELQDADDVWHIYTNFLDGLEIEHQQEATENTKVERKRFSIDSYYDD